MAVLPEIRLLSMGMGVPHFLFFSCCIGDLCIGDLYISIIYIIVDGREDVKRELLPCLYEIDRAARWPAVAARFRFAPSR